MHTLTGGSGHAIGPVMLHDGGTHCLGCFCLEPGAASGEAAWMAPGLTSDRLCVGQPSVAKAAGNVLKERWGLKNWWTGRRIERRDRTGNLEISPPIVYRYALPLSYQPKREGPVSHAVLEAGKDGLQNRATTNRSRTDTCVSSYTPPVHRLTMAQKRKAPAIPGARG